MYLLTDLPFHSNILHVTEHRWANTALGKSKITENAGNGKAELLYYKNNSD